MTHFGYDQLNGKLALFGIDLFGSSLKAIQGIDKKNLSREIVKLAEIQVTKLYFERFTWNQ